MTLELAIYRVLWLSGLLTVLALAAVIVLTGGWEAAAAGFMIIAGVVFGLSLATLLATEERTSAAPRA